MKNSYNQYQILLFTGFLFGFFLPLSTKISNVLIIIFLVGIGYLVFRKQLIFNKSSVSVLKFSTLILIIPLVLSIFFHGEITAVLGLFGRRISYFLIPLGLLFFSSTQLLSLKKYASWGIVYGSVLASIILLFQNFLNYYATRPWFSVDSELLNFYYTGFHFTEVLDIHPSYFGMYLLFSVLVVLFGKLGISKWPRIFMILLFFITILFLSARVILFFYFLIVLIAIFRLFLSSFGKSKKTIISFLSIVVVISLSIYFLVKETYIYTSLTKETLWELTFNVNEKYNSDTLGDSRVARWDAAMGLIAEHPFIGYGVGNEKDVLETVYLKGGMATSAKNRYDAHNLFIGYAIEIGLIGSLLLVFYLISALVIFSKSKKLMCFLFFLSVLGMCLIEDYLNNNAAITFLAFFGNLILFQTWVTKAKDVNEVR